MEKDKILIISSISLILLILDQILKNYFLQYFTLGQSIPLINKFLSFTLIHNTGAGFGILKGQNKVLIFISIIIIGVIFYYYDRIPKKRYLYVSIGLILGGALGNLLDRLKYGYVVDFIDFSFWPAFNLADAGISVGMIILGIYMFKYENKK